MIFITGWSGICPSGDGWPKHKRRSFIDPLIRYFVISYIQGNKTKPVKERIYYFYIFLKSLIAHRESISYHIPSNNHIIIDLFFNTSSVSFSIFRRHNMPRARLSRSSQCRETSKFAKLSLPGRYLFTCMLK